MIKIADLLDYDFSTSVDEAVKVCVNDPETVVREVTEYIATDRIRAEYERLFSAMALAWKSPDDTTGVWISGFFGAGKSSFAKNLGYLLVNREVLGTSVSSLFLQRMESMQIAEYIGFLNQTVPYEIFLFDAQAELPANANSPQIADLMYRTVLRDLGQGESYTSGVRPSTILSVEESLEKLFDACEARRPGRSITFVWDEVGSYVALGGERLKYLRAVVEQFRKISFERLKAARIPGPAWIVVTSEQEPHETLQDVFRHRIDLSTAGIGEVAARRVLRKKESQESTLRNLFRKHSVSLLQNLSLERCTRRTNFDEDEFVRFYPYLPHLIDISIDIVAGIRLHPDAPTHLIGCSRSIVKQCFDLVASDQIRFGYRPAGALVTIDDLYDLLEPTIPLEKQRNVMVISEHCEHIDYPGMAGRVAKAICLLQFCNRNLPRTTKNIAALLIQDVAEAPPLLAVNAILDRMREARLAREGLEGWTLYEYDFEELRHGTEALDGLNRTVGTINPRAPGWHNELIQLVKNSVARALRWYTHRLHEFNGSATRSLEGIVRALDRLIDIPIDVAALEKRVTQSEKTIASLQEQLNVLRQQTGMRASYVSARQSNERTAYVIGLFGTGRLYVCELIRQNIGERAKYFRDQIRLHIGPTSMIYSGHTTIRYVSRGQNLPAITSGLLEAVKAGFADVIFMYRHPLDSLLTNWVWWRTYLRDSSCISGIGQVYRNRDDLCADLEQNFQEFKTFAEGNPAFFAGAERGPRFLSFAEFAEETELYLQSPVTLKLRLEDFMIDPAREFLKIAEVMSVDLDLGGLRVARPKSKPYGYVAVKDRVGRFRNFIDALSTETKRRIQRIGYDVAI
jgi:hypothetical protein